MVSTSKRSALRFDGCRLPVMVKTASQEGKGILCNVSTNGCSLSALEVVLREGERVLVQLELGAGDDPFQAQGYVVRQESMPERTAIKFTLVEAECQARLRSFFSSLVREKGSASVPQGRG